MKTLVDWMVEGKRASNSCSAEYQQCKPLVMADGTTMSIQASAYHYCNPRYTLDYQEYDEFEIGFPSRKIECLMPYIDGRDSEPTDTVYGYVPKAIVEQAIVECGGVSHVKEDE